MAYALNHDATNTAGSLHNQVHPARIDVESESKHCAKYLRWKFKQGEFETNLKANIVDR